MFIWLFSKASPVPRHISRTIDRCQPHRKSRVRQSVNYVSRFDSEGVNAAPHFKQLEIVVLTVRIFCPHFGQTSFCMLKNNDAKNNVGPMANASSRLPVLMPYPETGSQTNQPLYQRSRRGHGDTLCVDFGMRWITRRKVVAAPP